MINQLKKILLNIRSFVFDRKRFNTDHLDETANTNDNSNYFSNAQSWADDCHLNLVLSRNRFRAFSCALFVLVLLLIVLCCCLIPLQHLEPLIIHHYSDGRVTVERDVSSITSIKQTQLNNDLVRYISNRESYDPIAYADQFHLTVWMSSPSIAHQYIDEQRADNPQSLIHQLGNHHYRDVHIDDIVILDQINTQAKYPDKHHNLAEVHAVMTDHDLDTRIKRSQAVSIIISWRYTKPSRNPDIRWRNWDGFQVTHYQVKQRDLT